MVKYSQEFKLQSVEKVLTRRPSKTIQEVANELGIGRSTLGKWVYLAKHTQLEKTENSMSKEKAPNQWNKSERLEALMHSHSLDKEKTSAYCREQGIYPHHLEQWKSDFILDNQSVEQMPKKEQRSLKQENKRLQKELKRKEKALSETAALLVLSKKCQAIWGEKEVD